MRQTRPCPCCAGDMVKAAGYRWRCRSCGHRTEPDGYLESKANGAPELPGMDASRSWTLRFFGLPLSPNDHCSLRTKISATKYWRELAATTARAEGVPNLSRARLSAVFYRRAVGRADEDNDRARLRDVVNGLVRAGVLPDDRREFVEWGDVREERGPRGFALVIEAVP